MTNGFDPGRLDPQKIIDMLMKNPVAGGAVGGLAGSVLGNILMGKGGGKNLARTTLNTGGLALVAGVAWKAWQQYQQSQQPRAQAALPPALPQAFDLESTTALQSGSTLRVLRAMVAAAKADGIVDPAERQKIMQRVDETGAAAADRRFVENLLDRPLDIESVIEGVESPELAAEVYAASALAVHPASRTERGYLDLLAARLGMEASLTQEIDRGVSTALAGNSG
ncbi:MAG: tellurite resistance TerB family protein [Gammaproteobacteria bacterium]|nr:MAG: tellurite resistance TerB family protein [Gammaproteobacteria bacterium]